jgi:hypothetical protein
MEHIYPLHPRRRSDRPLRKTFHSAHVPKKRYRARDVSTEARIRDRDMSRLTFVI